MVGPSKGLTVGAASARVCLEGAVPFSGGLLDLKFALRYIWNKHYRLV